MASYKPVVASMRVLEVLSAVNKLGDAATVSRLVEATGMDKGTTIRMLQTLMYAGYIFQEKETLIYRPTGLTMKLSSGFKRHKAIVHYLHKPMGELFQEIDWPSDLAIPDGNEMLIVSSSRLNGSLSFNRAPFHRAPILATSLGLAYISFCSEEERQDLVSKISTSPGPWNESAKDPKKFEELLEKIRSQGFATMNPCYRSQEFQDRVDSFGVPIMVDNIAHAAINVIYLRGALGYNTAREQLLPKVQSAAKTMGLELEKRIAEKLN